MKKASTAGGEDERTDWYPCAQDLPVAHKSGTVSIAFP